MERGTEWENFFDEHPKPLHFEENVLKIHNVCHQSTITKTRLALITVNLTDMFFKSYIISVSPNLDK